MHLIFAFMRYYPAFAISLAVAFGQIGIFYRRRSDRVQYTCFVLAGLFLISAIVWLFFRGDLHSDQWVRSIFQSAP